MMVRYIVLFFLLFSGLFVEAQQIKSQTTFRLLKMATSLTEAQQYDAAEEYFKKGLTDSKTMKDAYCQAFAHEGLGNLYSKTDRSKLAVDHYQEAIRLYRKQGLTVIADVVESLMKSVQGIGDLYAGVEIGAKGIKLSVIEVKMTKEHDYEYMLKADTSINTDAASLSYQSEKETHDAISILYQISRNRYQVPVNKIHIVISSGLKQELDRYNKVQYFSEVVRPKELDKKIKISYVTVAQESEYSFIGIVPQKSRYQTNQLDVGSGNTKGGYFNSDHVFVPVSLPYGTKSFQRLVESENIADLETFSKTAQRIMDDSIGRMMIYEFANKKEFKTRDVVYLSGGIVWALASFMHPGEFNKNQIEITSKDIEDFRYLVLNSFEKISQPDVTLINNVDDARASLRNINRVKKTYDQKALLAGAIWLDELIQQVNTINPGKKFIYPKYAYVGWISGYILDKVKKQYMGLMN